MQLIDDLLKTVTLEELGAIPLDAARLRESCLLGQLAALERMEQGKASEPTEDHARLAAEMVRLEKATLLRER